jgi:hypothetical protein
VSVADGEPDGDIDGDVEGEFVAVLPESVAEAEGSPVRPPPEPLQAVNVTVATNAATQRRRTGRSTITGQVSHGRMSSFTDYAQIKHPLIRRDL